MSSTISTSAPPSPSLKSLDSSRPASPLDLTEGETSMIQPNQLDAAKRHPTYYFKDGNVVFLVEGVLYNVHRYFFERDSSHFRSILEATDAVGSLALSDVSSSDFDEFLAILYPTDFRKPAEKSTPQWTSILHLAAKWEFESIKLLAIDNLAAHALPVDKIVLGRRYGIHAWLPGAYESVCTREDPLTVEEGIVLGVEDVIKISAARQVYGYAKSRFEGKHFAQDLSEIFGLGGSAGAQSPGPADATEEEEDIRTLEREVTAAQEALAALPATPIQWYCEEDGRMTSASCGDYYCSSCKNPPVETMEHKRGRTDKESKEQQLNGKRQKKQQRLQDLAAKQNRMSLFRR